MAMQALHTDDLSAWVRSMSPDMDVRIPGSTQSEAMVADSVGMLPSPLCTTRLSSLPRKS